MNDVAQNSWTPSRYPTEAQPLSDPATSQVLNLVTQSDEHYVQHLSAMLVSLFEKNKNNVINVFVLIPNCIREHLLEKLVGDKHYILAGLTFLPR